MLVADPPEHTRYRRLVTRAFSARAVAALRTRTEEIAEELLDAMAARGPQVDLVRGYAALLPLTVIVEVLGAPRAMREQFLRWGADGVPLVDFGIGYREFRRGGVGRRRAARVDVAALRGAAPGPRREHPLRAGRRA